MESIFEEISTAHPIEVFQLNEQFRNDSNPNKVNLTVGAYRTDEGKPWVLPVVRTVESQLASNESLDKEYLPVTGLTDFCSAAVSLCFGDGHPVVLSQRAAGVQALGGTGATRLALDFLRLMLGKDTVYLSSPSWHVHQGTVELSGFKDVRQYRYWRADGNCFDEAGMLEDLGAAPAGSVVLLQGVGHNPTGCDPTSEQWQRILDVLQQQRLFAVVDMAYQGLVSGDLDADARVPRMFADSGVEFFVTQSFSKNFGLYNERVGNLVIVTKSAEITGRIRSQLRNLVCMTHFSSPGHGARVVATVLCNPALLAEWRDNVKKMAERIRHMRQLLYQRMRALGTPGQWQHIVAQAGMFTYSGLSSEQAEFLRDSYSVYIASDGRLNVSGLTSRNVDRVAQALHETVTRCDS